MTTDSLTLIFSKAFSAQHQIEFVAQQKDYSNLSIDDFVTNFQIIHAPKAPHYEQCEHKAKEKLEHKEANQEKDATNKYNAAYKQESSSSGDQTHKHTKREIFCCYYEVLWSS